MERNMRTDSRKGVIAVALALVLAVGMWGGLAVEPKRVAAAPMSTAIGAGCSTASFVRAARLSLWRGDSSCFRRGGGFEPRRQARSGRR